MFRDGGKVEQPGARPLACMGANRFPVLLWIVIPNAFYIVVSEVVSPLREN